MHLPTLLATALLLCAAHASPVSVTEAKGVVAARQSDRGSYTVSGLGSRKQAILNAGGNTLDLAIAMLETERMSTDYSYGMMEQISILSNIQLEETRQLNTSSRR